MKTPPLTAVFMLFAALLLAANPAAAQTTQPAKVPPPTAAVQKAFEYVPGKIAGIAHIDVAANRAAIEKLIPLFLELEGDDAKKWTALLPKINSIDIMFKGVQPMLLIRGTLTPRELMTTMGEDHPFFELDFLDADAPEPKPEKKDILTKNGLYIYRRQYCAIWGDEHKSLPKGVMLVGFQPVAYHRIIASLGKGEAQNPDLIKLLKNADTSRPIWGAMIMPKMAEGIMLDLEEEALPPMPQKEWGSAQFTGAKQGFHMSTVYKDKYIAKVECEDVSKKIAESGMTCIKTEAKDNRVVLSMLPNPKPPLLEQIIASLEHDIIKRKRLGNMESFSEAIIDYQKENGGKPPKKIEDLYDVVYDDGEMLISRMNPDAKKLIKYNLEHYENSDGKTFKSDVILLALKNPDSVKAPEKTILAYARPELFKNEKGVIQGVAVVFANGETKFISYDDFKKQMKKQGHEIK